MSKSFAPTKNGRADLDFTNYCTIFIIAREVDLVAKEHHPLSELNGRHDDPIGGAAILAIVVKGLQQKLRGGRTGEV